MKFLNYLQEEYIDLYKNWSGGVEVYINPTTDDLKELRKADELRFTAEASTKNLFVWDASRCNHADMMDYLVKRKHVKSCNPRIALNPKFFNGRAEILGKKLSIVDSDDFIFFTVVQLKGKLEKDWEWLLKYFTDIDLIHSLQKELAYSIK